MSSSSFYCFICREIKPNIEVFQLHCKHMYCKECLNAYVESKLGQNKLKIKCFHPIKGTNSNNANNPNECNIELSVAEIKDLLTNEESGNISLKKYEKLKYLQDHQEKARECPRCSEIVLKSRGFTEMNCKSCNHSFCFAHGEAHQFKNESCDQYEQRTREENKINQTTIHKISKKCPDCSANVEKSGGCNHMKCELCDTSFCWLCGIEVSDSIFPAHFQWWNPLGCVNMQMHEAIQPTCCALYSARLLATLQLVILGPICMVLTVATILLFGCCCKCSIFVQKNFFNGKEPSFGQIISLSMSMWGMLLMGVFVFFPLGVIGTIVVLAIYPFWAIYRLCICQMPVPEFVISYFSCCWCLLNDNATGMSPPSKKKKKTTGGIDKKSKAPRFEAMDIEAPPFDLGIGANSNTNGNNRGGNVAITRQVSQDQMEAARIFQDPSVLSPITSGVQYLRPDHSVIVNHAEDDVGYDDEADDEVLLYDHKLNLITSNDSSALMEREGESASDISGYSSTSSREDADRTPMEQSMHEISNILGADALKLLLDSTTASSDAATTKRSRKRQGSYKKKYDTNNRGGGRNNTTSNSNVLSNLGSTHSIAAGSIQGSVNMEGDTWNEVLTPMGSMREPSSLSGIVNELNNNHSPHGSLLEAYEQEQNHQNDHDTC